MQCADDEMHCMVARQWPPPPAIQAERTSLFVVPRILSRSSPQGLTRSLPLDVDESDAVRTNIFSVLRFGVCDCTFSSSGRRPVQHALLFSSIVHFLQGIDLLRSISSANK